jgi:hypothetical protein
MATTTLNQSIARNYTGTVSSTSVFSRFINWCEGQQENRILWIGLGLGGHGCVITPITIFAIVMSGNSMALFMTAVLAMAMTLIVNLAALPTRITIPVFILTILVDLGVIAACAYTGFASSVPF